jgi:hypothetical protein
MLKLIRARKQLKTLDLKLTEQISNGGDMASTGK